MMSTERTETTQSKQERPDEAIGRHASDTAVRLRDQTERVQNKHDPAKQLKKAGTAGQESKVFILFEENGQVEPIDTLPLHQEAVKRKNQRARGLSTLCFSYKQQ